LNIDPMTSASTTTTALAPVLTPHGRLLLEPHADAAPIAEGIAQRLRDAFERGPGHGLLQLDATEVRTILPAVLVYWRDFAARFVAAVCTMPEAKTIPAPPADDLNAIASAAPPMRGAEYLSAAVLESLWLELEKAFRVELAHSNTSVQEFLKSKNPAWNLVGRVHFNLAENRKDEEAPFAFLATYTTQLSGAKAQHAPLGAALSEYAGSANKSRLLSLLLPMQRAAEQCAWLKEMVDSGDIFHPMRWSPEEAFQLLKDLPHLESAGVIVRVPTTWGSRRPPRPVVTATVGGKPPEGIGTEALLDFRMEVTLDGESLTEDEVARLLASSNGLHLVRGRWVEVDRERLAKILEQFHGVEKAAADEGLTFAEATRMLAGAVDSNDDAGWGRISAGPWLAETLENLRRPETIHETQPRELQASLRPYQQAGYQWLHLLTKLGLGACLADDMGLGKTMQVLALLLALQQRSESPRQTSLLVAPASLLANWMSEIDRFAPSLSVIVAHPSMMSAAELRALDSKRASEADLVITSYGSLSRMPWLLEFSWRLAILDEAQAIKNPGTRQTRLAKQLDAQARIALTGTPVENRLGDLWSIFDFINPRLLGTSKEFTTFAKRLAARSHNPYAPLRELVRPYILRRLKTDRNVISDLPDKTEIKAFCQLTPKQAALYEQGVKELAMKLEAPETEGIERRGIILAFLMRFKQICNHPSHWLGSNTWNERESGKFIRLREIIETIADRQEKVLVFTQFREATAPLAAFLNSVFGRNGLVLHGETEVRKRQSLVRQFQEDESVPFFVLSLKAGGTGLNLTAASHVIHFDRWWNPAIENQATDRAFRIGQTKNVLVQKFLCRGTVEEKIDALIDSKRRLSQDLLEGGADLLLTEMSNDDLLKLVALDIHTALVE
jgi:non-specific serine/threonine protein kinase